MHLLRRIAISNGDLTRKDAATAVIAQKEHQIIANWNRELEEEVWQKILDGIKRHGYRDSGRNRAAKMSGDKAQNVRQTP